MSIFSRSARVGAKPFTLVAGATSTPASQKQKLAACGLSDHYQQIFELTRLDEAISLHPDEQTAVAAL